MILYYDTDDQVKLVSGIIKEILPLCELSWKILSYYEDHFHRDDTWLVNGFDPLKPLINDSFYSWLKNVNSKKRIHLSTNAYVKGTPEDYWDLKDMPTSLLRVEYSRTSWNEVDYLIAEHIGVKKHYRVDESSDDGIGSLLGLSRPFRNVDYDTLVPLFKKLFIALLDLKPSFGGMFFGYRDVEDTANSYEFLLFDTFDRLIKFVEVATETFIAPRKYDESDVLKHIAYIVRGEYNNFRIKRYGGDILIGLDEIFKHVSLRWSTVVPLPTEPFDTNRFSKLSPRNYDSDYPWQHVLLYFDSLGWKIVPNPKQKQREEELKKIYEEGGLSPAPL